MSTISNDYIRREDAIDKINERQRKLIYCFGFENDTVKIMDIAKSIVTAIPAADVVPVVRCRDCKYVRKFRSEESAKKFGQVYECVKYIISCPNPDDFCSYGERKE